MKNVLLYTAGVFGFLLLIGIAGQSDYEEAVRQEQHYCDMVRLWEMDAAKGIAPDQRAGWPPYKGEEVPCNM
jgi:hypothetical protein